MKIGSTEMVVLPEGVTPEYVLGEDGTPVGIKFTNANAPAGTEVLRMEVEPVRGVAIVGHHVEVFTQTFDEGMTREEIARWVDPDTMMAYPSYLFEIRETLKEPPFTETTRTVLLTESEVTLSEAGDLQRLVLRKTGGAA